MQEVKNSYIPAMDHDILIVGNDSFDCMSNSKQRDRIRWNTVVGPFGELEVRHRTARLNILHKGQQNNVTLTSRSVRINNLFDGDPSHTKVANLQPTLTRRVY